MNKMYNISWQFIQLKYLKYLKYLDQSGRPTDKWTDITILRAMPAAGVIVLDDPHKGSTENHLHEMYKVSDFKYMCCQPGLSWMGDLTTKTPEIPELTCFLCCTMLLHLII